MIHAVIPNVGATNPELGVSESASVRGLQTANDRQEGGTHYKDMPIEVWDFIVANKIPYLEGNVIKYVTRWKLKGGIQDLMKAKHYLDKLIEVSK